MTVKNFKTAEEFYSFCAENEACTDGLNEIRGKTLADWWDSTERGDWMMWLLVKGVWEFTPTQREEYCRVKAAAWKDFRRVTEASWAEFSRAREAAEVDFERVIAAAIRAIIGNPFLGPLA